MFGVTTLALPDVIKSGRVWLTQWLSPLVAVFIVVLAGAIFAGPTGVSPARPQPGAAGTSLDRAPRFNGSPLLPGTRGWPPGTRENATLAVPVRQVGFPPTSLSTFWRRGVHVPLSDGRGVRHPGRNTQPRSRHLRRKRVRLTAAAKRLGKHVSSLHRWRIKGRRGVRLDCYLIGSQWYTTWEAVEEFIRRTTAAANCGQAETVPVRPRATQPQQRPISEKTERQLDKIFGPRRHASGDRHTSGCDATDTQTASDVRGDCQG